MKTLVKTFALFVIVIAGTWLFPLQATAQEENVSLQVFYDELSPYGTWIEDPNYGYVWMPRVDRDFSPYLSNGHWVFTDYGWTWVSDYPWGWAPFHYGRWFEDPYYGYLWIPDTEWGPAWVTWRQASGYIGWTPMGPGININIALGRSYNVPRDRWMFVRDVDFMRGNLYSYRVDRSMNFRIFDLSILIRNTRFDNRRNSTYVYGPRREDVQRFYGRQINPVHIRDYDRPGQRYDRDYLSIYRPQMQRNYNNGHAPAPKNFNSNKDVRDNNGRDRDNYTPNRNTNYQGGNTRPVQQPNANQPGNQREEQNARYGNANNNARSAQADQQPNGNSRRYQFEQQPAQRPNVNPARSQSEQQPARNDNNYNQGRNTQQVQQPAVNQQRNQREERQVQNARPAENQRPQENRATVNQFDDRRSSPSQERTIVNVRQEKVRMDARSDNKKEESNQNSTERGPRR